MLITMPFTQVRLSNEADLSLRKYTFSSRELRKTLSRVPWRDRTKPTRNPRTRAELKLAMVRRNEKKESEAEDIEKGHKMMWDYAVDCHQRHGTHDPEWWHMRLMQSSKKQKKRRRASKWNAYLKMKARDRKEGE